MRFLHTADWHLGRLFHQVHLTEDQAFVLAQLVDVAREARVEAVVIAGDVYDRAVPPPDAVRLLDDTLSQLLLDLRIPVILAAGNHDSPERLSFGARLLATRGLHLFGAPSPGSAPVVLHDADGPVAFYVVPFAEPAVVRERWDDAAVEDHESAMRAVIRSTTHEHALRRRSVFVAHAYVQGALASDSERPLTVGGAGCVEASNFDAFQYVALGHLHRPQDVGELRCRYAGAILKYSFDEVGQERSVTIVDMDATAACRTENVALVPRHDLRRIEGTLEDLLRAGQAAGNQPASLDYIVARLTDRYPVLDPIGRLRAVYPNILSIERAREELPGGDGQAPSDRRRLDIGQLFTGFYKDVTGAEPTADEQAVFAASAAEVAKQDREVVS